jgi:DHA1 family tetracycline resistance protein-like MFS transporter
MHPVGVIRSIWRDYPILKSWQLATFLTSLGTAGINSIGVLYMAFRFGWTPKVIGFYAAFMGVTNIAVQAGLVAKTIRVLGEPRALLAGIVVQTMAIGAAGFALVGWEFSAAMFVVVLGSVAEPARLAILNRIITGSERGRLSGANRSIISLTGLIAPGLFTVMFASVVGAGPKAILVGTPFFVCTVLMVAGFAVTLWSVNRLPVQPSEPMGTQLQKLWFKRQSRRD